MMKHSGRKQKNQRGVALMVAMFGLLLMALIGVAFMFMADTENSVNNNYRDGKMGVVFRRLGYVVVETHYARMVP